MIVLTGGAGFIGSCFLEKLNAEGITNILVVDHLGAGTKWKNLIGKRFKDYIHKTEFRDKLSSGYYGDSIKTIIHLGACSSTTEFDADYLFDNNLDYSKELAVFAALHNVRFIYASSAATYGDGSKGYSDNSFYNLRPLNCYGFTKHLFDMWAIDNSLDKKFCGLKYFNVFGPNEYHKGSMASMVYKSFHQINDTGYVNLFKSNHPDYQDGQQMRDFIYIKDVVDVMWKLYQKPDVSGIYNLGSGKARSWNDLVNAVFKAMNRETKINYIDMPQEISGQYQNYTQADMNKLKNALGVEFHCLEDSVKDYVQNYLSKDEKYI